MNSVVVAGPTGVESPNSVYADYTRRIKDIRRIIKYADSIESDEVAEKYFLVPACYAYYGVLTDLKDETRLPPEKQKELIKRLDKATETLEAVVNTEDYGDDPIVALHVSSRMSMRKIAAKLGINVSTVSRHVRKWAAENAELRGSLETVREVELARLDKLLEHPYDYHERIQLLDRKYRLMGLYASGPQVVVGIGVQQASQPRVIDGVARDISDESP